MYHTLWRLRCCKKQHLFLCNLVQAAGGTVTVTVKLSGFSRTDGIIEHGFHIHEKPLVTNKCLDAGPHFNPSSVVHGGPHSATRLVLVNHCTQFN